MTTENINRQRRIALRELIGELYISFEVREYIAQRMHSTYYYAGMKPELNKLLTDVISCYEKYNKVFEGQLDRLIELEESKIYKEEYIFEEVNSVFDNLRDQLISIKELEELMGEFTKQYIDETKNLTEYEVSTLESNYHSFISDNRYIGLFLDRCIYITDNVRNFYTKLLEYRVSNKNLKRPLNFLDEKLEKGSTYIINTNDMTKQRVLLLSLMTVRDAVDEMLSNNTVSEYYYHLTLKNYETITLYVIKLSKHLSDPNIVYINCYDPRENTQFEFDIDFIDTDTFEYINSLNTLKYNIKKDKMFNKYIEIDMIHEVNKYLAEKNNDNNK